MTDYREEQRNEIEALESIYPDELQVLSSDPYSEFIVSLKGDDDGEGGFMYQCSLKFGYTEKYPDEVPNIEVISLEGLPMGEEDLLLQHLQQIAEESLGMVMIFTLVSASLEWLGATCDRKQKEMEEERDRKVREKEESELRRFEGTKVTVETFLAWKEQFDAEMYALKKQIKDDPSSKKLTGKQLFLANKSLNESDLKFLEEGDGDVKVDESLFEDLDDLELDDET